MLGTVGPELTRIVNSDLTWNKISKGNRSSLTRARKSVEHSPKTSKELVNQDYKKVDMPVSESEKLGMTVVGCRSSEKVEQVPIKKRWFLFRSPSPPPRTPVCAEESKGLGNGQHGSCQGFHVNATVGCQYATSDATASADLAEQTLDNETSVNEKKLVKTNEQGNIQELSGISILATAACSNILAEYVNGCPGVEGSHNSESTQKVLIKTEPKEDPVNSESMHKVLIKTERKEGPAISADLLTEQSSASVSTMPSQDLTSSEMNHSPPKDQVLENVIHGCSGENVVSESNILLNEDDSKILRVDPSARDGRLHWDLNTMMDAWEHPLGCEQADTTTVVAEDISKSLDDANHNVIIKTLNFDCKQADTLTIVADRIPKSEAKHSVGTKILDVGDFQREIGDAKNNTERALTPLEFKPLSFEPQESKLEELKLDTGASISGAVCSEENSLSSGIDLAKVDLMDLERTESLLIQDKMSPLAESISFFTTKHAPESFVSDIVTENASAVSSRSTGNSNNVSSHQVTEMDSSMDYSLICEPQRPMSSYTHEENCDSAADAATLKMESCVGNLQESRSNVPYPEEAKIIISGICSMLKDTCDSEKVQNQDGGGASSLPELNDKEDVNNSVNDEIVLPLVDDAKQSEACEAQDVVPSLSTHANIETHPSVSSKRVQTVVLVDKTIQNGEDSLVKDATIAETQMRVDPPLSGLSCHDAFRNYHDDVQNCNNASLEEDGYDTDVSQGGPVNEAFERVSGLRMDYDSQYEDGELRESSLHAWEEDDGEDIETEHVDYGSDNRDTNNLGSENTESNSQLQLGGSIRSEVIDAGCNPEETAAATSKPCMRVQWPEQVDLLDNGSGSRSDQAIRDDKGADSQANVETGTDPTDLKTKTSGWDRLPDSCKSSSDMVSRIRYRSIRKDSTGNKKDRSDAEDKERKSFESRVNRREVFSRIEKPASCRVFLGKDRLGLRGDSSNDDESFQRSVREFGCVRPFGRGRYPHQRRQGGDLWADSPGCDRGLKRIRSPIYRGLASSRHCGPDDVESDRRGNVHRYHGRNGSPTDMSNTFGMHRGIRSGLEMSPDRCVAVGRGRSARYGPRIDGGGPRGRYMNDDDVETSLNYLNPWTGGRRSFSPPERRGNAQAHQFGPKSHSRSRTRSPGAWQSPRARNIAGNLGFRNRSRSPNFRSEGRVPRARSPFSRSGFTGDQESGFVPAMMGRDSPPPTSRWISYKQRSSLLDRRSPGRIGAWGERLELLDSSRKLSPNEYDGRSVYPGRFSEFNGIGRSRPGYKVTDDGRKEHDYRHGIGGVKQFRYNDVEDDDFVMGHNSPRDKEATDFHGRSKAYNRGSLDRRIGNVARRSRDEGGLFLQRQDRKYNNKSLGMQESDEDVAAAAPRRRIW